MQVALVYFQPFCCSSLVKCVLQPKNVKKITKNAKKIHQEPLFWEFKVVHDHRCW